MPNANAFSLPTEVRTGTTLREEIRAHTGTDGEASSILRSIERLGGDPSIKYYQMTPAKHRRGAPGANTVVWSVRAVRV